MKPKPKFKYFVVDPDDECVAGFTSLTDARQFAGNTGFFYVVDKK